MNYTLKLCEDISTKNIYKIESVFSTRDRLSRETFYAVDEDEVKEFIKLYEYYKEKIKHRSFEPDEAIKMLEEVGLIDIINDEEERFEWMLDVMNNMWGDFDYFYPALEDYKISYYDNTGKEFRVKVEKGE